MEIPVIQEVSDLVI